MNVRLNLLTVKLTRMDNGENYSDDESSNNLMMTSLPVAPLPKEVDLKIPPATGEEYLARVRLDSIYINP